MSIELQIRHERTASEDILFSEFALLHCFEIYFLSQQIINLVRSKK